MGQQASSPAVPLTNAVTPDGAMLGKGDVDCTIACVSTAIIAEHALWQVSGTPGYLRGKDATLVLPKGVTVDKLTRMTKLPIQLWVPTTHAEGLVKALQESYLAFAPPPDVFPV